MGSGHMEWFIRAYEAAATRLPGSGGLLSADHGFHWLQCGFINFINVFLAYRLRAVSWRADLLVLPGSMGGRGLSVSPCCQVVQVLYTLMVALLAGASTG